MKLRGLNSELGERLRETRASPLCGKCIQLTSTLVITPAICIHEMGIEIRGM